MAGCPVGAGHLAGVDADPELEADTEVVLELAVQLGHGVAHLDRRAHRAKRVVLVQDGDAEDGHDRVADVLLDRAAVPLERLPHGGEVAGLDVAEGLGVEPLAHGGGAGEVGEDDGDGLSHLRRRRGPPTPGTRFHRTILRERPPVHCPGMARDYPSVLDLVGGTPIVRLGRVARGLPAQVVAKLEYMNPGGSVKDRIGLPMIEAAEREGKLRPGGTIVEPTSGNTGVGARHGGRDQGYRMIFVMPDKMSQEKISLLRAYGAEVVVCPTAVEPESPESYYSVSDRLAEEIPGAFKPDQYSNAGQPQGALRDHGPGDLGADRRRARRARDRGRDGRHDHRAARATSRSRSPTCAWSAPTRRARSTPRRRVHPYLVEGIGEDFWPETFDRTWSTST